MGAILVNKREGGWGGDNEKAKIMKLYKNKPIFSQSSQTVPCTYCIKSFSGINPNVGTQRPNSN